MTDVPKTVRSSEYQRFLQEVIGLRPMIRDRAKKLLVSSIHPRIDESDVVQEVLVEACRRGEGFLRQRPMPLQDWLLQLLRQKHVDLVRYHVRSQRRSVNRERHFSLDESASVWHRISRNGHTPDSRAMRVEMQEQMLSALSTLSSIDQCVIRLRCIERLSSTQVAELLDMSSSAVSKRYLRALCKLRELISGHVQDEGSSR